ncbi:MAG: LPS assembly protein LptD [Pseudomonadota bacterium]
MRADARRSWTGALAVTFVAPALLLLSQAAYADRTLALCGPGFAIPPKPDFGGDPNTETIEITADDAELSEEGISLLRGNVQYGSGERRLLAESMRYDKPNAHIRATGKLKLWDEGLFVNGESAELDLSRDEADFRDATFLIEDSQGRGSAQRVILSGNELVRIEDAHYTTCSPQQEDWKLTAEHIRLDRVEDIGTARDVTVEFMGMPIFYSPWMTFPLSDTRKSGFLTPSFAAGGETGYETTIPYYFNIAPNLDATARARVMSKRGVMLGGEFRYLMPSYSGEVRGELVPSDLEDDDTRALLSLRHRHRFSPALRGLVSYDRVSDRSYFEDFGNKLNVTSTQHLDQRVELHYSNDGLSVLGRVQNYQTVDRTIPGTSRPYKRLPQVSMSYFTPLRNRTMRYGVEAEGTYFEREASIDGARFDVTPSVSYPMRTAGSFLIPTAKLRYTHYSLENTPVGQDNSIDRIIPTLSVDSGLFFDRSVSLFGDAYVQTLEPRVYYLFQGFDNQNNIPVFDTGEFTFNFAQLFRDDRFSSADRVGDANQVSLSLTSRLLSQDGGQELFRASVGQIRYFRDRSVTLPGAAVQRDDSSDFVGEVRAQLTSALNVTGGLQWNPHDGETNRSTVSMRYQPDDERVVNAAYRFVRGTAETTDLSFRWPLRHDTGLVGRWNYALADERTLDSFAGIEYSSCCWALRAIARRFLSDTTGDYTNGVFLQFELKGLAGLGRNAEQFLQRSIPGYKNPF